MVSLRPTASARPCALGIKPMLSAIFLMRAVVSRLMRGELFRAREAVERETFAALATSAKVTRLRFATVIILL